MRGYVRGNELAAKLDPDGAPRAYRARVLGHTVVALWWLGVLALWLYLVIWG